MDVRWFVIRQRDDSPIEVYPHEVESDAREMYEAFATSWSEVYLTRVERSPGSLRGFYQCDRCGAVEPYGGNAMADGAHACVTVGGTGRWRAHGL